VAEKILVPDIGGAEDVDVIEVMVSVGDTLAVDDPLITLEGDKATMEVPASSAGVVESVAIKIGDKVSEGSLILTLKADGAAAAPEEKEEAPKEVPAEKTEAPKKEEAPKEAAPKVESAVPPEAFEDDGDVHAGPGVRRIAYEFGIPLTKIKGSGAKGRIVKEDVQQYVKSRLAAADSGTNIFSAT